MELFSVFTAGLTAVILFIFGLDHFSAEIQRISGERFRRFLGRATQLPIIGVILGGFITAIIQSSSATSIITISLVNAGVLSFKNSVAIIFGSNIGTTVTAQLVAFKLTDFAPWLIILGFVLSLLQNRLSIFGKSIFYFGFVFFTLNLISSSLAPLQENEAFLAFLLEPQSPLFAILVGCVFTAVIQSSSVTTALAIVFTQQGMLGLENAIPLIMGANIGTTATAFIAVFNMDLAAKKTAFSHFLFNVGGVVVFAPIILLFSDYLTALETSPEIVLAGVHLIFNLATSILFIIFINPFIRLVDFLFGEGKMDYERVGLPAFDPDEDFSAVKEKVSANLVTLLEFLQENYNLVTLSIETNYRGVFETSAKRIEYVEFLKNEYMGYFSKVINVTTDENDSKEMLSLITRFDYLFQIHDSIDDLYSTKKMMNSNFIELKSDILLLIRELAGQTLILFDEIHKSIAGNSETNIPATARDLQRLLDRVNRDMLELLAQPGRPDAGSLTNFVTYSLRLKDKLVNFAHMEAAYSSAATDTN